MKSPSSAVSGLHQQLQAFKQLKVFVYSLSVKTAQTGSAPPLQCLFSNLEQNSRFSGCIYFVSINVLNRPTKVLLSVQLQRLVGDSCDQVDEDGDAGPIVSTETDEDISLGNRLTSDLYRIMTITV